MFQPLPLLVILLVVTFGAAIYQKYEGSSV